MNIYVVAEGICEKIIYRSWIPAVNSQLSVVDSISDVDNRKVYIFEAGGYPQLLDAIDNAIKDVRKYPQFNRLVISVDSDELSRAEKFKEISYYVRYKKRKLDIRIVVQHFCIETWALGNRRVVRPKSTNSKLRDYRRLFDVRAEDPELLPALAEEELTRSQFAKKYLRLIFNDLGAGLTYSAARPFLVCPATYFGEVKARYEDTGHIDSFSEFLSAFS